MGIHYLLSKKVQGMTYKVSKTKIKPKQNQIDHIKQRLFDMHGDLITLADGQEYQKMVSPLVFVDKEYGEWETSPNNVLNKGCVHPTRKLEKRKATNIKKYGVDNPFKSTKVKEKIKATLTEKYGGDHPQRCPSLKKKARDTNQKKYGVDYALQSKDIQAKAKATLLENHGTSVVMHVDEFKQKVKDTNLRRYGVENPMQNAGVRNKAETTNEKVYGGPAPACDLKIQQKIKETNLERYGGIAPLCSPQVRDKLKATNQKRYGVDNPFQNDRVKEKIKQILLDQYGVEHPIHNDEVKKRIIATCMEKYGYASPLASPEIRAQGITTRLELYGGIVLPNGSTLGDYLREHHRLDLNYTSCVHVLKKHGFDLLKEYVEGDRVFGQTSSLEHVTSSLLNTPPYMKTIKLSDKKWSKPDFKLSEDTYLDVDGLFFHSEVRVDKDYHFKKRLKYEAAGLRLIQIRENEIRDKPQIVKSIISNALGKSQRIYARKCEFKKIPWKTAAAFLEENHLQGVGTYATTYGLESDFGLVMIMCVRRVGTGIEISRMCTRLGYSVLGGFSRLVKNVIKEYKPTYISSWCDLRYADGRGYEKLGFESVRDVQSWSWTNFEHVYHRLRCKANLDERGLSEAEYALELKWVKIYDAGQRLFLLTLN
jgi:hypothetical protein